MKTSVIDVRDMLSVLTVDEVEKRIGEVLGVASVTVNYAARNATVRYDETRLEVAQIKVLMHQRRQQRAAASQAMDESTNNHASKPAAIPNLERPTAEISAPETQISEASAVATAAATPAALKVDPENASALDAERPTGAEMAKEGMAKEGMAKEGMAKDGAADAGRIDDPSTTHADEVARALGLDLQAGLTSAEASVRLAQDGPNQLRSTPRRPAWRRFLAHFHDPLVYLLLAAVLVALVAWVIKGAAG